ncbi:MAG: MOSC domain-containing protein, partial [Salaquimonas sp.]
MPFLSDIFTYPVKSFPGLRLSKTIITKGEGLRDDRRYAITNGVTNTLDGAWLTCRSFFINAVNDGLLKFSNESDEDTITLASPNGFRITWRKGDVEGLKFANSKMAEFIAPLLPAHDLPTPMITQRTQLPGMLSGYWDFNDSGISLMNSNSLKALSKAMGEELDIRRLRGNLIIEDLPAWEEFGLVGKRIKIGKAEFDILRPVKRCPATSVNPQTGIRDLKVPDGLMDHFGHAFCGIYAKAVNSGTIAKGDMIEIIGDAKTPLSEAANPADSDYKLWPK